MKPFEYKQNCVIFQQKYIKQKTQQHSISIENVWEGRKISYSLDRIGVMAVAFNGISWEKKQFKPNIVIIVRFVRYINVP